MANLVLTFCIAENFSTVWHRGGEMSARAGRATLAEFIVTDGPLFAILQNFPSFVSGTVRIIGATVDSGRYPDAVLPFTSYAVVGRDSDRKSAIWRL